MTSDEVQKLIATVENNIASVVFGKKNVIRQCLVALLAGEHILLEDVPGLGKTLLARAIAKSINGDFHRLQFTPDLLPADITGSSIYNADTREFQFVPGPIFANVFLADEINRTTPRTQSAMLEAMNECQVSAEGQTYPLPQPFLVVATENPVEFEGTYPLPESQLDRFLLRISVGYPDRESELQVLKSHRFGQPIDAMTPVLSCEQVLELQESVKQVKVNDAIDHYILDIVEITRRSEDLYVGVSTRGAIAFSHAVQAYALIEGRDYAIPDDVKTLAVPVLAHRVMAKTYSHTNQRQAVEGLIAHLVDGVAVPT
ncbi:MAG: MoxR family ATPase [Planctomycetaceae bacterium]|jgi:MoxR-like ATPase|nr:MoxR family ATPase [Planctomycetaceae bacterium]